MKNSGRTVAVTGDGINDAPALRHGIIGVAMGESGTDQAKQAAKIVLPDDSFSTPVGVVHQGRTIYRNIRKGVLSCVTFNAAKFVVNSASLALTSLFGVPLALNVLQILAIDLVGEILPIAALGENPEEEETMRELPRDPRERILNRRSLGPGLVRGSHRRLLDRELPAVLSTSRRGPLHRDRGSGGARRGHIGQLRHDHGGQLVSIIQRRSIQGLFTRYQFSNRTFWLAIGVAVAIMGVILSWPFVAAPHSRDEVCRDRQGQNVAVAKRRGGKKTSWRET